MIAIGGRGGHGNHGEYHQGDYPSEFDASVYSFCFSFQRVSHFVVRHDIAAFCL